MGDSTPAPLEGGQSTETATRESVPRGPRVDSIFLFYQRQITKFAFMANSLLAAGTGINHLLDLSPAWQEAQANVLGDPLTRTIEAALAIGSVVGAPIYDRLRRRGYERKHVVSDEEIGYRAEKLRYKGPPLKTGNKVTRELRRRDSFVYVHLPRSHIEKGATPRAEELEVWDELQAFSLREIHAALEKQHYHGLVAIDLGRSKNSPLRNRAIHSSIPKGKILAGRNVETKAAQTPCLLVDMEELAALAQEKSDQLEELVDALGNKAISEYFHLLRGADPAQREEIIRLLQSQLVNVMLRELQSRTPGSEWRRNETGQPGKTRVHAGASTIARMGPGVRDLEYRRMLPQGWDGSRVEQMLNLDGYDLKDRIQLALTAGRNGRFDNAKIALVMLDVLSSDSDLDSYLTPLRVTREEILAYCKQAGITIDRTSRSPMELYGLRNLPEFAFTRTLMRPLLIVTLSRILAAGIEDAPKIINQVSSAGIISLAPGNSGFSLFGMSSSNESSSSNETHGTEGLPPKGIDWLITPYGEYAKEDGTLGYYFTGTSVQFDFQTGQWIIYDEDPSKSQRVTFDTSYDTSKFGPDYMLLERNVSVSAVGETSFKLPMQMYQDIGALQITANGKPVPFKAYRLADGTVKVVFTQNLIDAVPVSEIHVSEWLYKLPYGSDGTVNTRIKVLPGLKGVGPSGLDDYAEFQAENNIETRLSLELYSIDPEYYTALHGPYRDPADYIARYDDIAKRYGAGRGYCLLANTYLAFSVADRQGDVPIAMAFGYGSFTVQSSTDPGVHGLRSDGNHAWTIEGLNRRPTDIEIHDATPTGFSSDPIDVAYTEQIVSPISQQDYDRAEAARKAEADFELELYVTLRNLAVVAAAVTGGIITYKSAKKGGQRISIPMEELLRRKDQLIEWMYSDEFLAFAEELYMAISYKGEIRRKAGQGGGSARKLYDINTDRVRRALKLSNMRTLHEAGLSNAEIVKLKILLAMILAGTKSVESGEPYFKAVEQMMAAAKEADE